MSGLATIRAEARADRHYEQLAEDAANAAETQAWTWHRKRHPLCSLLITKRCRAYDDVKYALVQGVTHMSVEKQLDYLVNGRTRKRL